MKWALVDSLGLDVVSIHLAKEWKFHARKKLQHSGYGSKIVSIRQTDHPAFGTKNQPEPRCFYHFGGSAKWL